MLVTFGEEGTTELLYAGVYKGKWKGPATGLIYELEAEEQQVTIDSRDVECMLGWKNSEGVPFFRRVSG